MELVTVSKQQLNEYVHYVDQLIIDHSKLELRLEDTQQLAGMLDKTFSNRLDNLIDAILEADSSSEYYQGLMSAYAIVRGRDG